MPGGRPLKFNSVEELEQKIKDYFQWVKDNDKPLTIERLAVFLDVSPKTIYNYQAKDEYFHSIKRVRDRIYADKTECLTGGKGSTVGRIFDLKNNYGWKDRKEVEHSGSLETRLKQLQNVD